MEIDPDIYAALDKNSEQFITIVPILELLEDLIKKQILSPWQVKDIELLIHTEDMNGKLLEILMEARGDKDFDLFCGLLKINRNNKVKDFGTKLEHDAKRGSS
ncbi:hypothetical protein TrispH2_011166 [Trichoplax sp. H2]|nr:hypothetical protein TrispH2_011166 [Trichoplax sp. H2]|eukprot:RDD36914.1 hypothetical protein TrispH2_011166 [Trichoplax sp. H2]